MRRARIPWWWPMPLSARVWTLPDRILGRSVHNGLNQLVRTARRDGHLMLGAVDEYDETRFTRMQMGLVIPELDGLAASDVEIVAEAALELRSLADVVMGGHHRYLIFLGD